MPIRARPEVRPTSTEPTSGNILVDPCADRSIDGDSTRVIANLIASQPTDIDPGYFETVQGMIILFTGRRITGRATNVEGGQDGRQIFWKKLDGDK